MRKLVYTAEGSDDAPYLIVGGMDITRSSFREILIAELERCSVPNPDRNIQHLDLCEWTPEDLAIWIGSNVPVPGESWETMFRRARYDQIQWSYPGSWERKRTMPPMAIVSDDCDAYATDDPKHPNYRDNVVALWDEREKGS